LLARAHAVIERNGRVFILVQLRAVDQQLSSSGSGRRQSRPKSFAYAGCSVGSVIELWRDTRAGVSSGK
jgi:hypothetical protein